MPIRKDCTSEQAKVYLQREGALRKEFLVGKVDPDRVLEGLQILIEGRSLRGVPLSISQKRVQAILGKDFIVPEQMQEVFGYQYTREELDSLAEIPWDLEIVKQDKGKRIYFPLVPMNILGLREHFGSNRHKYYPCFPSLVWYDREEFASYTPKAEWIAIEKKDRPEFMNLTTDKQKEFLPKDEKIPKAVFVVQILFTYFIITNQQLLHYALCSDSSVYGPVHIVGFDQIGLRIGRASDLDSERKIKIYSIRK